MAKEKKKARLGKKQPSGGTLIKSLGERDYIIDGKERDSAPGQGTGENRRRGGVSILVRWIKRLAKGNQICELVVGKKRAKGESTGGGNRKPGG